MHTWSSVLDNVVTLSRRAVPWLEGDLLCAMPLPIMSLFIPYRAQRCYTKVRLARGNATECVLCYIQDSNIVCRGMETVS